jgi:DNA-nicking Smr family endonuclease
MPDWDSGWGADWFAVLPRIDVGARSAKATRGTTSLSSELREELGSVEFAAEDLPWAFDGRRWRVADAVRYEDFEVLTVDLHGLSVRLADDVIDAVSRVCAGRTVRLVHGQGHHSAGQSVLRDHVREEVEHRGLRVVDLAAGHMDVVP